MKKTILVLISAMTFICSSANAETYICEVTGQDVTITFGLLNELPNEMDWDRVAKFKLSLQTTELPFPSYEEQGTVKEGDTYFQYTSDTSDLEFSMYLDEDEEIDFTLNGKDMSFSNCRYYEFNQEL